MGLLAYLMPKGIITHQSARVDIGLYLLDRGLMPVWVIAFLGSVAPFVEQTTIGALQSAFGGQSDADAQPRLDLGLWTGDAADRRHDLFLHPPDDAQDRHRLGHPQGAPLRPGAHPRSPECANTSSPPPIWALGPAIGLSISGGLFAWLFNGGITQITIVNLGVFSFLYALNGNFRHYHVSFRYPRWLEHWLQSPGMHHTHHSYLEKHWDTNLGLVTSIWDRLFGDALHCRTLRRDALGADGAGPGQVHDPKRQPADAIPGDCAHFGTAVGV